MLLLGLTNGYWATLCMMFGPMVVEPQDSERAGSVMLLCLVIGLGKCEPHRGETGALSRRLEPLMILFIVAFLPRSIYEPCTLVT